MTWFVVAGVVVVLLVAFFIGHRLGTRRALSRVRQYARGADSDAPESELSTRYRAALVVNPTKADVSRLSSTAEAICRFEGWNPPLVIETTPEDSGEGAASRALDEGVDVVIAAGGDGTVRAVASALAGSETPMGIVPLGTGNLLSRNLDIVLDKTEWALRIALWGRNRKIDVGTAKTAEDGDTHVFTVMTGLGFDAAVMADTNSDLKSRLGWLAYVEAGSRKLVGRPSQVKVTFDDDYRVSARVRSVLGGNCGKLQGGIQLLPQAVIDDGMLDVLIVSPKNLGSPISRWSAGSNPSVLKSRGSPTVFSVTKFSSPPEGIPSTMRFGSLAASLSNAKLASSDSACSALTLADFSLPAAIRAGFSSLGAFAI